MGRTYWLAADEAVSITAALIVEVRDYQRWNKSLKRLVETFQAVNARIDAAEAKEKTAKKAAKKAAANT